MHAVSDAGLLRESKRTPAYRTLYAQVIAAIVIGGLLGHFAPAFAISLKPLGDAFIALVKMIIAPVIFLTLSGGIAGMSSLGALRRVALKAFGYFLVVSTFALVVGLIVANVVQPGRRHEHRSRDARCAARWRATRPRRTSRASSVS